MNDIELTQDQVAAAASAVDVIKSVEGIYSVTWKNASRVSMQGRAIRAVRFSLYFDKTDGCINRMDVEMTCDLYMDDMFDLKGYIAHQVKDAKKRLATMEAEERQ